MSQFITRLRESKPGKLARLATGATALFAGSSPSSRKAFLERLNATARRELEHVERRRRHDDPTVNLNLQEQHSGRVNLRWRSRQRDRGVDNLGDALSPIIVEFMLGERGLALSSPAAIRDGQDTHTLFAIGSLFPDVLESGTVWGSGFLGWRGGGPTGEEVRAMPLFAALGLDVDVRAVRGPLTKWVLGSRGIECPPVYGDPAVLLPEFYTPSPSPTAGEVLAVRHFKSDLHPEGAITLMTDDVWGTVDRLAGARKVVSSALHAIIIAEAYGVPAVLVRDRVSQNLMKYDDYYLSTGRPDYPVARSFEEAARMEPAAVHDFTDMRRRLRDAFPYDLWV